MAEHDVKVTVKKSAEQLITTTAKDGGSVDYAGAIIDHLDIWTSAIEQKSASGRGSSKKFSLHGIKKLRELILELAVRGKLVPQDSSDSSSQKALFESIEKKENLIKTGVIKKSRSKRTVKDEHFYSYPNSWATARIEDLINVINGRAYKKPEMLSEGTPILRVGNLFTSNDWYYSDLDLDPDKYIDDGDLIYAWSASFGPFIWDGGKVIYHYHIWKMDLHSEKALDKNFSKLFLAAISERIKASGNGIAMIHMTKERMEKVIHPLPPLEEQHRIVAKVDELMSLCDALEAQTEASITAHQTLVETLLNALLLPNTTQPTDAQLASGNKEANSLNSEDSLEPSLANNPEPNFVESWQRVAEHFDTLFTTSASIDSLKQTILQLAVMGKLVPQASREARNSPNYETAAKLLERIAVEKAQLIADKKIKKQKIQAIGVDIHLFHLPEGWKWGQLGELTASEDNAMCDGPFGSKLKTEHYINEKGFSVVRLGNIGVGKFLWGKEGHISKEHYKTLPNNHIQAGDLIVAGMAEPLIRTCEVPLNLGPAVNKADCFRLRLHKSLEKKYISQYLNSHVAKQFASEENRGMTRQRINLGNCKALPVPIPPIEEQHRIVAKVDELMTLCEQLKARLTDAQTTQLHLTDAIVEQAV